MAMSNQAYVPSPAPATPPGAPPPVPHGHRFRSMDRAFLAILALSLSTHVGAYVALARTPPREEVTLEQIPDRFAKILIPEKMPEEEVPAAKAEKKVEVAEKPKQEKKEDEPAAEDPPQVAAEKKARHTAAVAKAVQSKGILKVLGALGGGGLGGAAVKDVFGEGGGMGDVASALAGAGGVAVASGDGGPGAAAAGGRRGSGSGSGAARIGDLGTTGGGGKVEYGVKSDVKVSGTVGMEEAEVDSPDIDQAKLGAFIRARMSAVKACYENQLKRNPSLRGKIRVRFTILETGGISDIQAVENSIGSSEVASCIVATMRTWRTQFHPSGVVTVEHGFVFSAN
ncbi:MAG TPA: AgmX/PglI C-terminal domain-containing protein [Anaeromyxobacteraceae bacterium]|jgi:outer membrane biosynthesis protein TonB|nr:AgmX/PglI C-terminal domain-containing protein [Anaeromyxobacteraceae bacterium]